MGEPKQMDSERLTSIREGVEWRRDCQQPGDDDRDVIIAELLDDRDFQASAERRLWAKHEATVAEFTELLFNAEADIARLRARVRVEAEDVERAGVTRVKIEAWLRANGWEESGAAGHIAEGRFRNWKRSAHRYASPDGVSVFERHNPGRIAQSIAIIARHHERAGLDILDEMAAMGDGE